MSEANTETAAMTDATPSSTIRGKQQEQPGKQEASPV